ncbi:hypothetical protein D3C87_1799970 [compost metagenome]
MIIAAYGLRGITDIQWGAVHQNHPILRNYCILIRNGLVPSLLIIGKRDPLPFQCLQQRIQADFIFGKLCGYCCIQRQLRHGMAVVLQPLQVLRCQTVERGSECLRDIRLFHVQDSLVREQHGRVEKAHACFCILPVIRPI